MKRVRKITVIIISLIMILPFSSCIENNSTNNKPNIEANSDSKSSIKNDSADTGNISTVKGIKKLKVGFSQTGNQSAWRIAQTNSIKGEAIRRGIDLVYTDAQEQTAKQISDIEYIVSQNVNYLIFDPREFEGLAPALEIAKKANIPVIVIDRDIKGTAGKDYLTLIAPDMTLEGQVVGEWLAKFKNGIASIVEITGNFGSSAAIDRQKGFKAAISNYPQMKIITSESGEFVRAEAQKVMESIIQTKGKQFDAVFCHTDEMAIGVIQALKAAGIIPGKDVVVVGIDGQKDAVKAIVAGELAVTITCDPHYGPIVFDTIEKLERGETVPKRIEMKDHVIDSSNASLEVYTAF